MTNYGGDPKVFQLRDMNRRLTSLELAALRKDVRIRNLSKAVKTLQTQLAVYRVAIIRIEERIS